MHGQPDGSSFLSWNKLHQMQPDPSRQPARPDEVRYLMHNMQRITLIKGKPPAGNTVGVMTQQTSYDALLVAVYSPLNETIQRTILIEFQ
jgi:hypothetical protein